MAFSSGSDTTRRTAKGNPLDLDVNDWAQPEKEPRDLKKLALVIGLGLLSWVATYVGMLELIEANMGDLPLVHKLIIGFSVAMLMTMVVWLLDQLFAPINTFTKIVYAAGYLFLTVISVGFGFGFYWKVLESRSEASRSAEGAVGSVQGSLFAASTRLEQLQATLDQLTNVSTVKAKEERDTGKSCPNSKPGDGPRRKLREDDAGRFSFASEFVKGRVTSVKAEMEALNGDLAKILSDDKSIIDAKSGTRNEFMKSLSRKLDLTVTGFNAFRSDPQLKQIRTDLAERADRATFPDTKGATFSCPDPQLSTALQGVVRAIDELPILEKPKIAAVEGSEATIEAFRRLTATFYGLLSFKMPPSADELRELQKKAVQSVEGAGGAAAAAAQRLNMEGAGLSKRDYVPLAIALFVDICLLLVSMGRPMNRLGGLVHKMREAERGPMIQILSRFNDIHRDPEIRRNFEVFRHVVFDFHGDYYVAVPLDAPYGSGQVRGKNGKPVYVSQSLADIADAQVEAHILANLFTSFEKERIFTRSLQPVPDHPHDPEAAGPPRQQVRPRPRVSRLPLPRRRLLADHPRGCDGRRPPRRSRKARPQYRGRSDASGREHRTHGSSCDGTDTRHQAAGRFRTARPAHPASCRGHPRPRDAASAAAPPLCRRSRGCAQWLGHARTSPPGPPQSHPITRRSRPPLRCDRTIMPRSSVPTRRMCRRCRATSPLPTASPTASPPA